MGFQKVVQSAFWISLVDVSTLEDLALRAMVGEFLFWFETLDEEQGKLVLSIEWDVVGQGEEVPQKFEQEQKWPLGSYVRN